MKKNKLFWILTVICVLNFAAHLYFYPSLPDIVPTHWGASGQVNGWGPKSTVLILAALPFAMLILFEVIRKIDPKHQNFEKFGKVWNLFVVLFTVMTAAFSWLSELAVFGKLPDSSNISVFWSAAASACCSSLWGTLCRRSSRTTPSAAARPGR